MADCLERVLLHDDERRCRLLAWAIMPNHAHVLVEISAPPMSKLVQSWKKLSTDFVNKHWSRKGRWWQPDYHDRYIRDEAHFHKAVHYIENNPVKASLAKTAKEWPWGSARWRPEGFGLQSVEKRKPEEQTRG